MYECHRCGKHFEEPDWVVERYGLDSPPYDKVAVCPYCHGYFEEMYQCQICGEWFTDDELTMAVCDECIYKHESDHELCYKLGNEESAKESITINGFVASVFTEEQINEILMRELRNIKDITNISCIEFIGSDKSWFAEQLIKEKNDAEDF